VYGLQLKALELQGFKSFPDKTVLQFDASITAVVGPNGSGKSNISDAIRWVMGEQSTRALRGGKMEDVIFGGTQTRKSHGFAEVSLTLGNEDGVLPIEGSELAVTRRYYRSGDSEYYINRRLVRLRDIHELFMDTGLGQEGYSLIGQGKIDEILSVKSTQRREIFEEAAGISRYRHRKEEAERKLTHTRDNLLRIADKLEELQLQLSPLEEQAEKAKRYFLASEELRGLEVSLWMQRLSDLRALHSETRVAFLETQQRLSASQEENERLYTQSEELLRAAQEKDIALDAARRATAQVEEESAATRQRLSVLAVQLENNNEAQKKLEWEAAAQQDRDESLQGQLAAQEVTQRQLLADERCAKEVIQTLDAALKEQQEKLSRARESLQTLERQAQQESQAQQRVRSLLSALDASAQEVGEREASLLWTLEEARQQLQEVQRQALVFGQSQTALRMTISAQEQSLGPNKVRLAEADAQERAAQEAWVAIRMEENALWARVRMLEDMEKIYEGYSKSVKTVMEQAQRGSLEGVLGPVAALITVPESYAVAIEIALGGAMQHLVVETEQSGKRMLNDLKRRDGGRVTCLPLDAIRASRLDTRAFLDVRGYLGLAADVIGYAAQYDNIIAQLLGKVVLVSDLESGLAMARQFRYRFRIVTLDGQVLSPGGAMTGGSTSRRGGILTRASELSALREKQQSQKTARLEAEATLEAAKQAHAQLVQTNAQAQEKQQETRQQLLILDAKAKATEAQEQELQKRAERLDAERTALSERTQSAQSQSEQAQEKLMQIERSTARLIQAETQWEAVLKQCLEEKEVLTEKQRQEQTRQAVTAAEQRALVQSMEALHAQHAIQVQDAERRHTEHTRREAERARMEREVQELAQRQEQVVARKEAARSALSTLTEEKLALEGSRAQVERESRSQNERLLQIQKETVHLEQKKLAGEQEEAQLLDRLWERYELSHEAARAIMQPLESASLAERRIGSLKSEIRALGHVNLGAVEEYARVRERYEYLYAQKTDVEESDGQLVTIIEELVEQMKQRFRQSFFRINEAFGETFRELFGGGAAELLLEDERDILNCGIEIRVQPPGKSLKNLNLLSGGEKAFVAIALYFSILKIRPTPFCVLDEIEAALDDANVLRFARYLRGMSQKTQFIVITHRRGTMEEADLLYGVTMEQAGVSRMLRMNLKEAVLGLGGEREHQKKQE